MISPRLSDRVPDGPRRAGVRFGADYPSIISAFADAKDMSTHHYRQKYGAMHKARLRLRSNRCFWTQSACGGVANC
ncbi:hypothetical protein PCAR4_260009 [Paraburkholderia caribensis]|nr:hypothetical protein PCAR4_260009 [Paraburkholderia caribensis]